MPERSVVTVTTLDAPWGPIHAAASTRGITAVAMLAPFDAFLADLSRDSDVLPTETAPGAAVAHLDRLRDAFGRYVATSKEGFADVPLDLRVRSTWDRLVLEGVRSLRTGEVASYGEIAARIGRFGAARAVGGAVGRNPIAVVIPCHRVVAAGGRIGGYGGDWYGSREERLGLKRALLRHEGVVLRDDPGDGDDGEDG